MKSTATNSAAFVLGLLFGMALVISVALAEGDPLPPDSVIPELQESQDGIGDTQTRVQVYAEMAESDAQLREELEAMAKEGNAEARAVLDLMAQTKAAKSAVKKVKGDPKKKAKYLEYGSDAIRDAILYGGYWDNPFFQGLVNAERARREKAMKEAAARQRRPKMKIPSA